MMDFLRNPRRVGIVLFDLVFTAFALVATFYVRFENGGFSERLHWLLVYSAGLPGLCRRGLLDLQAL